MSVHRLIVCMRMWMSTSINTHKTKHKNHTTSKQQICLQGPFRECRSIRSGASGLLYYCAPIVCISVVIELLGVWWHNKPKTKKEIHGNFSISNIQLYECCRTYNIVYKTLFVPSPSLKNLFMCKNTLMTYTQCLHTYVYFYSHPRKQNNDPPTT